MKSEMLVGRKEQSINTFLDNMMKNWKESFWKIDFYATLFSPRHSKVSFSPKTKRRKIYLRIQVIFQPTKRKLSEQEKVKKLVFIYFKVPFRIPLIKCR